MERNIKPFLPQTFEVFNGIGYFRLEDGQVAVERTDNVIITSSKEDNVELITMKCGSKVARFWKVNDELYALTSRTCVTIPEDTIFADCYSSSNYEEGVYVKYMSSQACGIIYVSETEVSNVISYKKGYQDICFENELFYADSKEGDNKYHVIGESGRLLGAFPSKCRKLDEYILFYDDDSIYINSSKVDIPGGVSSLEVIKWRKLTFVKVVNSDGIYYYTKEIEALFGPIKKDEIQNLDEKSCFIYETENEKITQVFYIQQTKEDTYVCEKLSSGKEIECYEAGYQFFATDKSLYVLQDERFIQLITRDNISKYAINETRLNVLGYYYRCDIVGYQESNPVYHACYEPEKGIYDEGVLERIADGYEEKEGKISHICRKGERIIVIDYDGAILISTEGEKCYKKTYRDNPIYFIEKGENKIALYRKNGRVIL